MHPRKPLTFFFLATLLCLGPATIPQPANAGTTLCPNRVCDFDQGEADSVTYCAQDCCDTIYYDAIFCCGNGIVEEDEECDDGNLDDDDGCNANCIIEFCGDGSLQPGLGEECDDGNLDDGDGCNANCIIEFCGDGSCDPEEQFGDPANYCALDCCGNGICDPEEESGDPANYCAQDCCDPFNTCNGNGTCAPDGSCLCDDGYDGENCNTCATNYLNYPICTFCDPDITCAASASSINAPTSAKEKLLSA